MNITQNVRFSLSAIVVIFLNLAGFGLDRYDPTDSIRSSTNPVNIPLEIRQAEFKRGNIAPNPSFENLIADDVSDSQNKSVNPKDWTIVGENVGVVNVSKIDGSDNNETSSRMHAIKIVRTYKDVKEIGDPVEGVISDFIDVIPANYDFYFDIRLERVIPTTYLDRFQRRIEKSIDIHLEFYDKDKNRMDNGVYFEYVKHDIDNGFKGFAFANYFYIDKFDWSRVKGESWVYPFSEGDIPNGCKYVRIFFGLRSEGTMWIDNVDFRLSKWSFSPLERMDSFFNRKNYDLTDLLIPTPKSVINKRSLELSRKQVNLVYLGKATKESEAAISLLKNRLGKLRNVSVSTAQSARINDRRSVQIYLSSSPASLPSYLSSDFDFLRGKDQGYFIRSRGNEVYVGATTQMGIYYAASTISQLIDYNDSRLDIADIIDYPDFEGRSSLLMSYQNRWALSRNATVTDSSITSYIQKREHDLKKQINDVDFYAFYRINELYSLYFIQSTRWWIPGEFYKKMFEEVGKKCNEYGDLIHTAVQTNPYFHIPMEQMVDTLSDSIRNVFSHATNDGFEKILNTLRPPLDAGAKTVMICADDYVPHEGIIRGEYVLFNKEDKEKFTNLADAQTSLLNKLRKWLDANYKNIRLEFVPAQYNNRFIDYGMGSAETFFRDLTLHLDKSVVLVWTGNTIRSLSYDLADINRVSVLYKQPPMIWDNSPYARMVETANGGYPINYPEKSILCNIFEPFDVQYPLDFQKYLNSRYYSNLGGFGEINKIKYMTFADFTWNTKDYNPEFSLFKALYQFVGKDNAKLLIKFNDSYFRFIEDWGLLRMRLDHDSTYEYSEKEKENAQQHIRLMKSAYEALFQIDNADLKSELKSLMDTKIAQWEKLSNLKSNNKQ